MNRRLFIAAAVVLASIGACTATPAHAAPTTTTWVLTSATGYADTTGRHNLTRDPVYTGVTQTADGTTFNGHGRLNGAASADFSPGAADFALLGRIRTTDLWGNVFQLGNTTGGVGGGAFAKFEVSGKRTEGFGGAPRCRFTGTAGSTLLAGPRSIADGQWHSFECRKLAVGVFLLIDGVVVASQPRLVIGSMDLSTRPVYVGAKGGTFDEGDALTGTLQGLSVRRG